jgi:hypothetical protein
MIKDLRHRGEKNVLVTKGQASAIDPDVAAQYSTVERMDPCIEKYCNVYAKDLAERLSLNERNLPDALATPTLLNPMFGSEKRIVGSGLMSEGQYFKSRQNLLRKIQDILDKNNPILWFELSDNSSSSDDDDDDIPRRDNTNYGKAKEELEEFERFKRKKYLPTLKETSARCLTGESGEMMVGPVHEKGKNLPTGHNLFDYIDIRGRIDLVRFFSDHSKVFPTLWVIAQKELSRRVVEVGCERFFGLSGYISSPRRTRLGVRTYERLAMLASIVHTVYINDALVAAEYLRRCKAGSWKKENTVEAVKCWNLERIIDAELRGESMPEEEITMNDLVNEDNACIN